MMSVWRMLIISLGTPKHMADLLETKKRKVLGYLAMLILLCLIPTFITTSVDINVLTTDFQKFMKSEEVPDFQLKNGLLISTMKKPVVTKIDEDTFVFDTTGTYDAQKVRQEKVEFAVLSDRLITYDGLQEQQILFADLGAVEFSKADLNKWIDVIAKFQWLAMVGVIIIVYMFQYAKLLLIALVLALIGLLIYSSSGKKLPFGRLWVLAAFSATIPTMVSWVLYSVGLHIPYLGFLYLIACSIILYLVLREISQRATVIMENEGR
jgi:hypothetical protein